MILKREEKGIKIMKNYIMIKMEAKQSFYKGTMWQNSLVEKKDIL